VNPIKPDIQEAIKTFRTYKNTQVGIRDWKKNSQTDRLKRVVKSCYSRSFENLIKPHFK